MKKRWVKILLTIIIIGVVIGIISILWVFRKSPDSVGSKKPDIIMEAQALSKAFENNENEANKQYLNKVIQVTGTIESIKENGPEIAISLKENGEMTGVICNFTKGTVDITKHKAGDKISVKGICNGFLMDVVLKKCKLTE